MSPLPFVFLNVAMTADGKIAPANRKFSSFSSQRDREHMFELRATADAVMSGARTVDLNPVTMGTGRAKYRRQRKKRGLAERHVRVVVSGGATLDPNAEIFRKGSSPVIVLTTRRAPPDKVRRLREVADEVIGFGTEEIDFKAALRWLGKEWGVRRLLCEGGGEINGGLFRAGLVDELHLTVCPKIFGGRDAPTIADGRGVASLAKAARFKLKSARRYGDEMFFVFAR
ncbi:MAG: 2,5-diamino-6-(ribosylamino)-4(3H)-pyrimidinone 5'-phosphate reductase [Verrucomicrobia bacterium]|nr:MAG: 2,5-diamino-6-(ribosylamino)-4(3H)-pyrimidinone 5'-phosphate reductase [Verrucomicrobiota bacterium]